MKESEVRSLFLDKVKVLVKSGKGGDGIVSFKREKYMPDGGPSGGDGGRGGDVVLEATGRLNTLEVFRYKRKFAAQPGENGGKNNRSGKDGEDILIQLPVGTVVFDAMTGRLIADMVEDGQKVIVAKGGRGGRGNQHFATSIRQAPQFAKPGDEAEEFDLVFELKLIADVGLVGFPNVGKSTILSMVTNATPKIANYHFTTLSPNLGMVKHKNAEEFVMADIPGLIEGASEGQGLGHDFLRHVERTRLLIHVLDVSGSEGRDPVEDFDAINRELFAYSEALREREQIVALNKVDLITDGDEVNRVKKHFEEMGHQVFIVSAATGKGLDALMDSVIAKLPLIEKTPLLFTQEEKTLYAPVQDKEYEITVEDGVYMVRGKMMRRLINSVNLADYESSSYFQKVLKNKGVFEELKRLGVKDGDTVSIEDYEFDYYD